MAGKGNKVFLSYARSDRETVKKVGRELRQAGFEVWDPDEQILPGADWSSELKMALDSADAFVVFISPEAMSSRSVSHEIEYALGARHLRGRLIPVTIQATKHAPWILSSLGPVQYENPSKTGRQIIDLLDQRKDAPEAKIRTI